MNTQILGLFAETSIHSGAGQGAGIIDLPVAREAATDYPVIPGSSLKGALLGLAREKGSDGQDRILGQQRKVIFGASEIQEIGEDGEKKLVGGAGSLVVSEARLLLLPVRSLSSAYKWVTCPHLLERFSRDTKRVNHSGTTSCDLENMEIKEGEYLGATKHQGNTDLFLEERQFSHGGELPKGLVEKLSKLIPHESARKRLADQLIILHDDDFAWFARYGLAVQARNVLNAETKTSENLWYEESVPADALFYAVLAERGENAIAPIKSLFANRQYLQVGGNETVGMGWFAVAFANKNGDAA